MHLGISSKYFTTMNISYNEILGLNNNEELVAKSYLFTFGWNRVINIVSTITTWSGFCMNNNHEKSF
jgi:hypothetical protein